MDRAGGRAELWRRYDAGQLTADELEARLRLVDRIDDDASAEAVRGAVDGPVPIRRRRSTRRVALAGAAAVGAVAVLGGVLVVAGAISDDGSDGADGSTVFVGSGFAGPVLTVVPGPGAVPPPPVECDALRPAEDISGESAANPALLTDPPFTPEGYEHGDDDSIPPGSDPDIAMATSAGNPLPVEIAARELDGDLVVRLRGFRYASADDARASAESVSATACSFGATRFEIPDRPELLGTVVSGPIPTTAFAGWILGDRRFLVSVESEGDDPDDLDEAQALAGRIAAAELDFARTAPPTG